MLSAARIPVVLERKVLLYYLSHVVLDIDAVSYTHLNLALMKLSAWHKLRGDTVEFADPGAGRYDKVYLSKVFTHTPDCRDEYYCEVIRGGTGYRDYTTTLPEACLLYTSRCVAKLTLNVTTAGAFTDFELRSCQVTGVPSCVPFFAESKPTADGGVTSFPKSVLSGRSYSVVLYLPENAQGEVPGISDPQQLSLIHI